MGRDVEGKDVLIVDDMIASGESVLDIALELKRKKCKKCLCGNYICILYRRLREI